MSIWDAEGRDPRVGNAMIFDALREQHVTPNGNGWRHELKISSDKRHDMSGQYEAFRAKIKAELSPGSKTIVAQHHASDTGTIMKLYISDTNESGFFDSVANNGVFDVYVRMAREDGSGEDKFALGTITSGDSFDLHVINNYGKVTVTAMDRTFQLDVEDSSEAYFKFGNYLQAQIAETGKNIEDKDDWEAFYADAGITESVVTFTDVFYTRTIGY